MRDIIVPMRHDEKVDIERCGLGEFSCGHARIALPMELAQRISDEVHRRGCSCHPCKAHAEQQSRIDSQRQRIRELEYAAVQAAISSRCPVCEVEDRLKEKRFTQSHPIQCIDNWLRKQREWDELTKKLEHDLANAQQAAVLLKESKAEALREEREKALKEECHCGERVREHTCPEAVSKLMNHHLRERMWRPIETAPKDGSSILIIWPRSSADASDYMVVGWSDEAWRDHHRAIQCSPTHWMPLPEPPR